MKTSLTAALLCSICFYIFTGCSQLETPPCSYPKILKTILEKKLNKSCGALQPEDLAQIQSLQFKSVKQKDFLDLKPEHFKPFTRLFQLDLSENEHLTQIPEFVYGIASLKKLDVSSTGISDFGSQICRLQQLESLIGENNTYKNNEIPFHTFCIKSLKTLDMSSSRLIYVDEYIFYLQDLEKLHLNSNELHTLPFLIKYMPKLQLVDLRGNKFEDSSINSLYDCTQAQDSGCQEDIIDELDCEWHYKFNHERGESFRQWKPEGDQSYLALINTRIGERHTVDEARICYEDWIASTGGFDDFETTSGFDETGNYRGRDTQNADLLQKTINGKTIREWRLLSTTTDEHEYPKMKFRGAEFYNFILHRWNTLSDSCLLERVVFHLSFGKTQYYLPDKNEYFPELYMPEEKTALTKNPVCIDQDGLNN